MAAPKGNRNARKAKDWERALRTALHFYEDPSKQVAKGEALPKIARKVVELAIDGDATAIAEIANRLDGKATEHVESEITHRYASELSDDELQAIASGSSDGATEAPAGTPDASAVH